MSKRSFQRKAGGGKSKNVNPQAMLSQMQAMQQQMVEAQEALANETVTVTAGGGAVSIVISGHQRVQSITINPEVVDPEDVEMLQDMLVAAVNAAIEQSQALSAERMEGITGGMGGGLNDLLGGLGGL
ncbi:MAG: YbaB/EbfC family nucleoid-associated protein [Ardenticatenaceae bacterium]|nr:YbaB/EbfC family nucleoid-associated protein [Ardenticatenaceae bacterium]MCB8987991.1 YbaB/EbfC family nucleoid-associated protein [Ardenticatenaceae bacterium]